MPSDISFEKITIRYVISVAIRTETSVSSATVEVEASKFVAVPYGEIPKESR